MAVQVIEENIEEIKPNLYYIRSDFVPQKGDKGDVGERGLQGIQGEKGDNGIQGIQGPIGPQGAQGNPGSDASVTKANVEAVLTGNITSHSHQKICAVQVLSGTSALSVVNGKAYIRIPSALNGMNLVMCGASVVTKSTSGNPTIQFSRGRQATPTSDFTYVSMLSTSLTIDANEYDSSTATTAYVIDAANDDVLTGDLIRIDITGAGTGTSGLNVTLTFQLP